MKFHNVHGGNIVIDDGATRATRCNSFCDGIAFSHKPLAINCRLSLLLGGNDEWTGALRLGITTQDPSTLSNTKLPCYACPDLTSKAGFWARPLPEKWACNGTRLTFYVNSCGHLNLFVNSEHKGAILIGLPVKEQLWVLLDLYGVTVSAKFIATTGSAPIEVVARGPEAVLAYQNAVNDGSTPYHCTRLALIGPPNVGKTALKKVLVKETSNTENENNGIDASWVCQTSSVCKGEPWILIKQAHASSPIEILKNESGNENETLVQSHDKTDNNDETTETTLICDNFEEAYFQAIAFNVAHELLQQKKKKNEERRKTALSRSAFKLHSSLSKISPVTKNLSKPDDNVPSKEKSNAIATNLDLPHDLPERVVQLVEAMLKESENKLLLEKKDFDKYFTEKAMIRFNIWDYCGCPKYFLFHQMFLCSQTIYLLVFDLSKDLDSCTSSSESNVLEFLGISNVSIMACLHMWLELIYVSVSYTSNNNNDQKQTDDHDDFHSLFPTVIIVGTRKEALSDAAQVEHQFNKLKESLQDKIYFKHILPKFYAISFENSEEDLIQELRKKIEELTIQLSYVGVEIPLKWLLFEQAIDRLLERDVYFADINKLSEVARLENIESEEEFYSMVQFFHHKGKIWHLGSDLPSYNGIVILKPQWFINYIYQLLDLNGTKKLEVPKSENNDAEQQVIMPDTDIIDTEFFEKLWPRAYHQINVLLGILDIADVICEIPKSKTSTEDSAKRLYFLPWLSKSKSYHTSDCSPTDKLELVLEFSSSLPVCFLLRFFLRLYRSSKHFAIPSKIEEIIDQKIIAIDYNHEIALSRISPNRLKVCLMQKKNVDPEDKPNMLIPNAHICSKVRYLLEKEAEYLQDRLYKRLNFSLCVSCPCDKICIAHSKPACKDKDCLHLLKLNDCLSKKVVECDFRVVKTDFIQKFFNNSSLEDCSSYNTSARLSEDFTFAIPSSVKSFWEDHDMIREEPVWIRVAGKMLTLCNTGRDWIALAKRLGYSEKEVAKFQSEIYPPVSLLSNWLESNGQTRYCVDLLVSCLEQMGRQDVVDKIHAELGPEPPSSPVFISYQWDAQELVFHLRRRLELAGYPCWMDVGNINGGDSLYGRIYEGISKSKVVLCCLTPRYALSPICSREVSLADVLRKPIIPVMLEPTPWPPPGPMALILSSLVYIDLCDIGGHGGCGRQADWESRFLSIAERISHFISPSFLTMNLAGTPGGRMAPPPDFPMKPDNFLNSPGQLEHDSPADADTADEGDTSSVASSTRDQPSSTPTVWEQTRPNNTVVRCSICILL